MTFQEVFGNRKPVIAMLHLKGKGMEDTMTRAKREIEIFYRNGVDAVMVENYFGRVPACREALAYLRAHYPDKIYGVNILGDTPTAFELAKTYGAKFIQIDSVCGHLAPEQEKSLEIQMARLRAGCDALVLGGVRFKYQPVCSGRTEEEDLAIGKTRCDAVVVTGDGTGLMTPEEKIDQFRAGLGDFPLITGAGVTEGTVADTLRRCDGVIVGSWLKEKHDARHEVKESYVARFMQAARG